MKATGTQRRILLVEDNPADMELVREWIQEKHINVQLTWVEDGTTAIQNLKLGMHLLPANLPNLILLDINLPRMSGIEVLREIKTHESLKKIPVVMLTSSSTREDVNASYTTHANAYVQKDLNLDAFFQSLGCIHCMFLETSIPPEY